MMKTYRESKLFSQLWRWSRYYVEALGFLDLIVNWYWIPMMYLGLVRHRILLLKNGLRFLCFDHMDALVIKEVFGDKEYILKKSGSGKTIIDIGANIGGFSIFAATISNKNRIYCYEPARLTFAQLLYNVEINRLGDQITARNMAVYKNRKPVKLYTVASSGMSSIYNNRGSEVYEIVQSLTLKDIFENEKIKTCDFLKMDCEGAEYDILLNTDDLTLKKVKHIAMECHYIDQKRNPEVIIEKLKESGFNVSFRLHHIETDIGYIYAKRR